MENVCLVLLGDEGYIFGSDLGLHVKNTHLILLSEIARQMKEQKPNLYQLFRMVVAVPSYICDSPKSWTILLIFMHWKNINSLKKKEEEQRKNSKAQTGSRLNWAQAVFFFVVFFFVCFFFSELGTEPRALRFLGKRSTTELNPQPEHKQFS